MRFVKAIWKLLVGIKDALVLLFMLMFFGLLYAALSARPAAIGDGVLAMDLDGVLVEQAVTARSVRHGGRRRQHHPRVRTQGPDRRARRSQGRRPGQGDRARSRRLPRRRPACDRRARRKDRRGEEERQAGRSPSPPATPTTATSSPPTPRKSGCRRWARSRSPGRAATTSISRDCSTSLESPPTSIASAPTSRRSSRSPATTCRPRRARMPRLWAMRCSKPGARTSRAGARGGCAGSTACWPIPSQSRRRPTATSPRRRST